MELDPNKINVEVINFEENNRYEIKRGDSTKKIFIPKNFYEVEMLYSDEPYSHEDIAECYVKSDSSLNSDYERYKARVEKTSYKDFLILNYYAIAVADKTEKSAPEIICNEERGGKAISCIFEAYFLKGYKVNHPNNPMQRGTYGNH